MGCWGVWLFCFLLAWLYFFVGKEQKGQWERGVFLPTCLLLQLGVPGCSLGTATGFVEEQENPPSD